MADGRRRNRRDYGTHSVYQRADGRWYAAIDLGLTERGTRRRITVSAKTEPAVKVRLRERLRELDEMGDTDLSTRTTVKQWADQWLPLVERTLRPQPYIASRSAVRRWIVPTIGHKQLVKLTPRDIRAVADAQRAAGLTTSTQRRTHSVLRTLLTDAQQEGYAIPPRVLAVKAPDKAVSGRTDVPVELAIRLLGIAAELPHGSRWAAALLQGMRQGECLGLTWDQVDLERGLLVISWQLQPLPYRVARDRSSGFRVPDGYEARQLHGRLHLVRPKTKAGWRVIPLVPWMRSALLAWREIAPENPAGLVWPTAAGTPTLAKNDDEEWYALQTTAGEGHPDGRFYSIHEARHATATLLLEAGVDPTVITAILGHSSIVTSRGYMHVRVAPLADAMGKVADRLALGA
ncbi:site-specific integrase [Nocardioides marinquilinus]|uniref:Site-specific integrase n=1 Tax=Nocardioides marinquilinus TaxID=1210400 RepID=A0ABP9PA27_9ACTN